MTSANIRIVADSSCDLYKLDGADFVPVPLTIRSSQKEYIDNEELNIPEMVDSFFTAKTVPPRLAPTFKTG